MEAVVFVTFELGAIPLRQIGMTDPFDPPRLVTETPLVLVTRPCPWPPIPRRRRRAGRRRFGFRERRRSAYRRA